MFNAGTLCRCGSHDIRFAGRSRGPGDGVLGVNINGETKAYPLRIVNAHEMVNDTVGGEPISLMW